ncbi:uncharacterized protein LOC124553724 isoform X5 [Schistocerca americana]|uniref:uncharacterized protein LOC124553724 isoform X5 n=1 Tax=Schistocerca americana TaxID=7009 RepID=UPI001F4F5005|nr:uncharacterized protein LOC124553724 isoform X5 [Schistocerca americana]XP_049945535.1 uncharacterized protein LOC126427289 isoform X7 [Schistocerca serialis cubense]
MDQDPTMWIKKEETDEEDPMCVEDLLELSWSTDVVKEDPEVNVEVNVTENIIHSEYWWELWHFIRRNSSPWTAQG